MATRRTRSAIGYGAGARPADGRLPLRPACGVGNVKGMQDLGAPRAGSSARSAPLPIAPFEKRQSRLGRWFDNWLRSVGMAVDRKSTRLNSSHSQISYAVFCLKK